MVDYKNELNPEQYEAVTTINGPVAIDAGAGSGKTRVLTYRTMYMIESGISPENILLLTFTNKAADEMKQRIDEKVGKAGGISGGTVTACTFHSFCVKVLRAYGSRIRIDNFTVLAPGDDADIINMIRSEDGWDTYPKSFPQSATVASILSASVNRQQTIEAVVLDGYKKYFDYLPQIKSLIVKFNAYRKENNTLNYDDLLTETLRLFETCPGIVKVLAEQYKYIMVDEYQDSNKLQEKLLYAFAKYHRNIAIVGDAVQSLYGFRGADIHNILDFPKRFKNCKRIYLKRNYRSNQEIIDFSNEVTKKATETKPHSLVATHNSELKPKVITVGNQMKEAEYVNDKIRDYLQMGHDPHEICVLCRNSSSSGVLEGLLQKENIAYVKYGGPKYFDLEYIKDIISFLRIYVNQKDEIAWFRVLQLIPAIRKVTSRDLAKQCKELGVEGIKKKEDDLNHKYDEDLKELYNSLIEIENKLTPKNFRMVIDFYHKFCHKQIEKGKYKTEDARQVAYETLERHVEEMDSLQILVEKANSIEEFLDSTIDNPTQMQDESNCIVISTIHSSKGLEFQTVFVLDCADGIFPRSQSVGTPADNEELRCFYVAVTRAKENLYIICPQVGIKFGKRVALQESHYIPRDMYYSRYTLTKRKY